MIVSVKRAEASVSSILSTLPTNSGSAEFKAQWLLTLCNAMQHTRGGGESEASYALLSCGPLPAPAPADEHPVGHIAQNKWRVSVVSVIARGGTQRKAGQNVCLPVRLHLHARKSVIERQ